MASRTRLLPRNENERFETPPRDMDARQALADLTRRFDEGQPVAVVFLDAGRNGEDVRIEDDVLGPEPGGLRQQPKDRSQISTLRSTVSACPASSNAMTTTQAP